VFLRMKLLDSASVEQNRMMLTSMDAPPSEMESEHKS
jgi:hypothetical protein